MTTEVIALVKGSEIVQASLLGDLEPNDLIQIERQWAPWRQQVHHDLLMRSIERTSHPQSLHWDWELKAPQLRLLAIDGYAIACEREWQAAVMLDCISYLSRIEQDKGRPLVYVDFIEVAPWNWKLPGIGQEPRLKGCGSILFRRLVKRSLDEGFHGRVGCHALPQAEAFYEGQCRMQRFGPDKKKQNLVYFELSREDAKALMNEGGIE